jgi:uncharacterized protein (UPF0276 family)
MQIAVNYSPQAAALLTAGAVRFGLYKCPDWPDMVAQAQMQLPAYVHFPLMAGRNNFDAVGLPHIEALLAGSLTPFINTHLAPKASDFAGMPLTGCSPVQADVLMQAMREDVARLVALFGAERVILENANWDPNYEIPDAVLAPERITQIVDESGCGLLLDIAHAHMAAVHRGEDTRAYIERMPLHALRELHIAGTRYDEAEQRWVDHFPMTDADWSLTEWALAHIHAGDWSQPRIVALEYGGVGPGFGWRSEADVLARDVPRLWALVHGATGMDKEDGA